MTHSLIRHRELWSTPLWEVDSGFDDEFNDRLIEDLTKINVNMAPGPTFNMWNQQGSANLDALREKILEVTQECTGMQLRHTRSWVNHVEPGGKLTFHDHGGHLAVSYYMSTPENCGDLLLIDSRGSTNGWDNIQENSTSRKIDVANHVSNRKYVRVKPVVGRIVFFPTYVIHGVEPNFSGRTRIGLACNMERV